MARRRTRLEESLERSKQRMLGNFPIDRSGPVGSNPAAVDSARIANQLALDNQARIAGQSLAIDELNLRRQKEAADAILRNRQLQQAAIDSSRDFALGRATIGQRERQSNADRKFDYTRLREQTGLDRTKLGLAKDELEFRQSQPNELDVMKTRSAINRADDATAMGVDLLKQARGMKLSKEGENQLANLSSAFRRIQETRKDMDPEQYESVMSKWMDAFDRTRLDQFEEESPSAQSVFDQRRVQDPQGNYWLMGEDGKLTPLTQKSSSTSATEGGGFEYNDKARAAALKELNDRWAMQNTDENATPPQWTPAQIAEEAYRQQAQAKAERDAFERIRRGRPVEDVKPSRELLDPRRDPRAGLGVDPTGEEPASLSDRDPVQRREVEAIQSMRQKAVASRAVQETAKEMGMAAEELVERIDEDSMKFAAMVGSDNPVEYVLQTAADAKRKGQHHLAMMPPGVREELIREGVQMVPKGKSIDDISTDVIPVGGLYVNSNLVVLRRAPKPGMKPTERQPLQTGTPQLFNVR